MHLTINNKSYQFVPIHIFRTKWGLADEFSIALFEPKDWTGLGSLDRAGEPLLEIRQQVLQVIPPRLTQADLLPLVQLFTNTFHQQLNTANAQIGLRTVEIDFAVAGFHDVIQSVVYKLVQLAHTYPGDLPLALGKFSFAEVYFAWLNDSVQVSATKHIYNHSDTQFEVYVVNYAYGRIGLEVHVAGDCIYVADSSLACPAAGYMQDLCADVSAALCNALIA